MKQLPHHLAAVWFADIVGYSALSEEDEAIVRSRNLEPR